MNRPDANGIDRYDDDVLTDDELTDTYEPVPDLIRTVADYEGLPDGTILKVVEAHGTMAVLKLDGYFRLTGVRGPYAAPTMAKRYVCSVVRLGGSQ